VNTLGLALYMNKAIERVNTIAISGDNKFRAFGEKGTVAKLDLDNDVD
jgi:hypothetical protein